MNGLFTLLRLLRTRGIFSILARLPQYLKLSWRLMWDSRTPWYLKIPVLIAVLYGLSPFDLIPEAILPHIGWIEDIALLLFSLRNLIQRSPPQLVTEHAREIAQKSEKAPS